MTADSTTMEPGRQPAPVTDLAEIPHEFRTPLNSVIGLSSALARGMAGPLNDKQSEYVTLIEASGRHLLALVGDILEITKSDAGRLSLHRAHQDLAVEIQPELPRAAVDAVRIKQVILNLLSNAIGFTPEEGQVALRAHSDHARLAIEIADTGIGIPTDHYERIFEPFVQIDSPQQRTRHGTGLGLPLSGRLIEQHGGTLPYGVQPPRPRINLHRPAAHRRQRDQRAHPHRSPRNGGLTGPTWPSFLRRSRYAPGLRESKTDNWQRRTKCPT